jgi:hypothetical protein
MKRHFLPITAILLVTVTLPTTAHDTNDVPRTRLEAFEATTGRVVIKGTEELGSIATKNGTIFVMVHEYRDVPSNQRQFGIAVTVRQNESTEDTTTVDEDELAALIAGIDYVSKADPSISSLNHFEAFYASRAGLRVASYSSRRTSTVEASVTSHRYQRSKTWLNMSQLAQFKNLVEQAQTKIEAIRKTR